MKKHLVIASLVLILLALGAFGCSTSETESEAILASTQQQGIWVNGQGKVTASPDLAIITLGVQAQETTVSAAQTKATDAMNMVISALSGNGVAAQDIQTQRYSIQVITKYDQVNQMDIITGYQVTNIVTAKTKALDTIGIIIDAVAAAGGDLTRIEGINFTIEDPTTYQTQARQKAITDAKAKADQMANLIGVDLGNPTLITESITQPITVPIKAGAPGVTPISPGQLDITVNVQIVYKIR